MLRDKLKSTKKNDLKIKNCVLYALLIVILAEVVIYFLGLKSVHVFLVKTAQNLKLDLVFYDFLYFTEPYLHLERLIFLKNWFWLVPFIVFSFIIAALHTTVYEKRFNFTQICYTAFFASMFKLFSYSMPYGVYPIFLYFFDFLKKFYMEPAIIFMVSFISLFFGTAITLEYLKKICGTKLDENNEKLERYKYELGRWFPYR